MQSKRNDRDSNATKKFAEAAMNTEVSPVSTEKAATSKEVSPSWLRRIQNVVRSDIHAVLLGAGATLSIATIGAALAFAPA